MQIPVSSDALRTLEDTAKGTDRVLALLPFELGVSVEARIASEPAASSDPTPQMIVQALDCPTPRPQSEDQASPYTLAMLRSAWGKAGFTDAVRSALDLIAAGDCYQTNLAHRLVAEFSGDAFSLWNDLVHRSAPEFGGFISWDDGPTRHAVASLSPELFLRFDAPTRTLRTRPMKGTRAIGADPDELRDAPKDRAELNMIVDLMRNDLGRVCAPGSVRVTRPRDIESHAGSVWQATATIEGTVRDGLGLADILGATFPPGSVTGAPKIRATQILRSLEPHARGPYCGSLVSIDQDGSFTASVLIRTAHIVGTPDPENPHGFLDAELRYHAGAGIVADSDPEAEWQETLVKARVLETLSNHPDQADD